MMSVLPCPIQKIILFLVCACTVLTGAVPTASAEAVDIDGLIDQLADPDPEVRSAAARQLISNARVARPAIVEATSSDDPEVRAQAERILRELPLSLPDDSPVVAATLDGLGRLPHERQVQALQGLMRMTEQNGPAAVARVLAQHPSEPLRWVALNVLRSTRPSLKLLRQEDIHSEDPPLLIGKGIAWYGHNSKEATTLLDRGVRAMIARGQVLPPESEVTDSIRWAFQLLVYTYTQQHRLSEAMELLRGQASITAPEDPTFVRLHRQLLALHADHGPLPGFVDDLKSLPTELTQDPFLLYCANRFLHRSSAPLLALPARLSAGLASRWAHDPSERVMLGKFFFELKWDLEAIAELSSVIDATNDNSDVLDAHYLLMQIGSRQHDHAAAAEHVQQMLAKFPGLTMPGEAAPDVGANFAAQMHLHEYLHARRSGQPGTDQLDQIASLRPNDGELAMRIVPILKRAEREDEATQIFEAAHAQSKAALDGDPESPEHKNNLAWLCARSHMHLEEAVRLSQEAIATDPNNAAYLDTAAEALYRTGKFNQAIELEQQALKIMPNDLFMSAQLRKYQRAANRTQK